MSVCLVGDRKQLRSLYGKKLHPHQEKDVPSVGATGWGHRSVLVFKHHSNAEMICIVLPSISTSRVCEKAISVRLSHERAPDAFTSDEVSRS